MMSQSTVTLIVLLGLVGSAQLISAYPNQYPNVPGQLNSPPQMGTNSRSNLMNENNHFFNSRGNFCDGTNCLEVSDNPMMQQQQPGNSFGNFQNGMAVPSQQRQGANFYSGFPGGMNNMASMNPLGYMQQQQLPQQQMQQQMQQSSMPAMQGAMNNNGMDLNRFLAELFRYSPQAMNAVQSLLARLSGNQQMPLVPGQAQNMFQNPSQMSMGYGQYPNNYNQQMSSNPARPLTNSLGQNPMSASVANPQQTMPNAVQPQQGQHGLLMPQSPQSQQSPSPSGSGSRPILSAAK